MTCMLERLITLQSVSYVKVQSGSAMVQVVSGKPLTMDWPGFHPRPVQVGFVMDKVAVRWGFLRLLWISSVIVISLMLCTHV
jgi:hypothetical protein